MLTICWQRKNMFLRVSVLILYHIHGKCLILKTYISTVIEGKRPWWLWKDKHTSDSWPWLSRENRMVYLSLRPHSISHIYLERESFSCFFLTAYTLFLSRVLNVCQLPSVFFWCLHADTLSLFSQCLSLSAASTLIRYGLQALDTAQLPDSDEHITDFI